MSAMMVAAAVQAKPVGPERACEVAMRYFAEVVNKTPSGWEEVYLFVPTDGRGFVLVSADDCARPVLAYSREGVFDAEAMPDHVATWVGGYRREIASLRAVGAEASEEVRRQWDDPKPSAKAGGVGPLLTTQWSQSPYYNARCPYSAGSTSRVVTGCVATAMAQVMKYWNHPAVGHGSHSYMLGQLGQLRVDYDTAYRWWQMPDRLKRSTPAAQVDAVAQLMYHVGVSVSMSYGVNSSGAQVLARHSSNGASAEAALRSYFRYSPFLRGEVKMGHSDSAWAALMKGEIDSRRPVLYSGFDHSGGHAFVLDGYKPEGGRYYFHVNWGWGGSYDGYYTIDSLSPGGGGTGGNATYTFNLNNAALVGIQPSGASEGEEVAVVSVVSSDATLGEARGSGRYATYRDTARVEAVAAEGYRFDRWYSGINENPLVFVPNGDFADTAVFVPIGRDTIGYSPDKLHSSVGIGGREWGIRVPASRRNPYRSLTAVQLYVYAGGDYTLSIYRGGEESPAELVHRQRFFRKSLMDWETLVLDSAVYIDNYEPVWVVMSYASGGAGAARAAYGGERDGSWYRTGGSWRPYMDGERSYSWMIRAVFAGRESRQFSVGLHTAMWDGTSVDPDCLAEGGGLYPEDTTVTLTAVHDADHIFLYWVGSRGDTVRENPYRYRPVADVVYTAVFGPKGLGVEQVVAEVPDVRVQGREVRVGAVKGESVAVYDIQGRQLGRSERGEALRVEVAAAGVYIVSGGGLPRKVLVR